MSAEQSIQTTPRWMFWTGWVITVLIALFMMFDGVMKLIKFPMVVEATMQAGFPESAVRVIGAAAFGSTLLFVIPRTAVLGTILLTAYYGGAVCTHVRLADGLWWSAIVFGIVTWFGIFLRDARLWRLVPLRQRAA